MKLSKLCNTVETSNSRTPLLQRFSCGVGHVLNDITLQLICSFRLVFFIKILGLSATNAGWLLLFGYFSMVVSSSVAAFLIDRINVPFLSRKMGRRKSWHLIGTVIGVILVPLYFSSCFPCRRNGGDWQLMIYFPVLNTILSLSYSLMEIGHLSLIPSIAKDQSEAVELNAWRTVFSFLSGAVTFLVAWAILGQDGSEQLSAETSTNFSVMTLTLVGIGLVFALIFHVGTKERFDESEENMNASTVNRKQSFVPSHSLLQSMTYMGTDLHCRKERLRDRFIDSVKSKEERVTEETEGGAVRKRGFAEHFISALLTIQEEEQETTDEVSSENGRMKTNASYPPQTVTIDQEDDEMLKTVKQLPNERKISLFMSIINRLIGEQNAASEQPQSSNNSETFNEMRSHGVTTRSQAPSGVENHGLEFDGLRPSCSDPIPSTEKNQAFSENISLASLKSDEKSSVVSFVPESGLHVAPAPKTAKAWLKDPHLYKVTFIFTCTSVVQSTSYAYLPLFLIYTLQFEKGSIAYLPFIMLISATVSSGISKKVVGKIGSKWCFITAAILAIVSGVWFYLITVSSRVMIYPAVVLTGFGFSSMFVNALSFAADLIGENKNSSGFVFAFMCILSYLTNGALGIAILSLFPEESTSEYCGKCGVYVRYVIALVPGSWAALSLLVVLLFQRSKPTRTQNALRSTLQNAPD